jgi:hypothetical protein
MLAVIRSDCAASVSQSGPRIANSTALPPRCAVSPCVLMSVMRATTPAMPLSFARRSAIAACIVMRPVSRGVSVTNMIALLTSPPTPPLPESPPTAAK